MPIKLENVGTGTGTLELFECIHPLRGAATFEDLDPQQLRKP